MTQEPSEIARKHLFSKGMRASAFTALFAFLIMQGFAYWQNFHMLEVSDFTLLAYLFLNIAVYGLASVSATSLLDKKKYFVIALATLAFCSFAIVMNVLAFANVFSDRFILNGYDRVLYPQFFLCLGAIALSVFCSMLDSTTL